MCCAAASVWSRDLSGWHMREHAPCSGSAPFRGLPHSQPWLRAESGQAPGHNRSQCLGKFGQVLKPQVAERHARKGLEALRTHRPATGQIEMLQRRHLGECEQDVVIDSLRWLHRLDVPLRGAAARRPETARPRPGVHEPTPRAGRMRSSAWYRSAAQLYIASKTLGLFRELRGTSENLSGRTCKRDALQPMLPTPRLPLSLLLGAW